MTSSSLTKTWPLSPDVSASAGMRCCITSYGSKKRGRGVGQACKDIICVHGCVQANSAIASEERRGEGVLHNNAD